jgi:outer membrane protein
MLRLHTIQPFILLFSFLAGAVSFVHAQEFPPSGASVNLSLADLFRRVESGNLSLLAGRETVEQARQERFRNRSNLLPSLRLDASQVRSDPGDLNGRNGDAFNQFEAKAVANWRLLDPNNLAEYSVAKLDEEVAELRFNASQQDVFEEAAFLYFTHLRNVARLDVIDANLERDDALLALARNQFEAGVATPIDVTRAEVSLANNRKERLQQETLLVQSRLAILRLLDLPLDNALRLQSLPPGDNLPGGLDSLDAARILPNRPEYIQAEKELERNKTARKAAAWERFPSVNLIGEWGFVSETAFDGREENEWLVGIAFSMPIWEGFRIRSNKLQADSLVRSQEYVIRDIENRVGAQVRLALQDVRSRFQQIQIARETVTLSERELELARTRFEEGISDNRDVVEAQANLAEANDSLVESVFRYNLSRLVLARTRGDTRLLLTGL